MSDRVVDDVVAGRRVALVIGVSAVPTLSPLPGVESGVDEFFRWATDQGIEAFVFSDFNEPVVVSTIYQRIDEMLDIGDVVQLFIYFAGHGFVSGGTDLWLFSDAPDNPGAAVNVGLSVRLARRSGIPHVVFFSDACRSPVGKQTLDILGQSVFPSRTYGGQPQVDQFFATRYGDPAAEKVPEGVAERAFGIFSRCLMAGLRGEDERAVSDVDGGRTPRAVLSTSLRTYLEQEVPVVTSREAQHVQMPECTPLSQWKPNVLAWLPAPNTFPVPLADTTLVTAGELPREGESADALRLALAGFGDAWRVKPTEPHRHPQSEVFAAVEDDLVRSLSSRYEDDNRRARIHPSAGASVMGADVSEVISRGRSDDALQVEGAWHLRDNGDPTTTLVHVVAAGTGTDMWAGLATLPGYAAAVTISDDGVEAVQYRSLVPQVPEHLEVEELASAMAEARLGSWDPDRRSAPILLWEELNPTLVILAAYHFDRWGQDSLVGRLLEGSLDRYEWVPFDVALLADVPPFELPTCPSFPMMTRGWSLLDSVKLPPEREGTLRRARRSLRAAPWTTFTGTDANRVRELAFELTNGE